MERRSHERNPEAQVCKVKELTQDSPIFFKVAFLIDRRGWCGVWAFHAQVPCLPLRSRIWPCMYFPQQHSDVLQKKGVL